MGQFTAKTIHIHHGSPFAMPMQTGSTDPSLALQPSLNTDWSLMEVSCADDERGLPQDIKSHDVGDVSSSSPETHHDLQEDQINAPAQLQEDESQNEVPI